MRFYNPDTDPPEQIDSEALFPGKPLEETTARCLRLGLLPSVTSVLGVIRQEYIERWKMAEAVRNFRRHGNAWLAVDEHYKTDSKESQFGTAVHEAVKCYLLGEKHPQDQAWRHAQPAISWLAKNLKELRICEKALACKKTGVAGTVDLAFLNKEDVEILGDLKVVKMRRDYPTIPSLSYRCQLSAYEAMIREKGHPPVKRLSIYLASPFGDLPEPKLMVFPYQRDYLPDFRAALQLWHAQYGIGAESVENTEKSERETFDPKPFSPKKSRG